MSANLPTSASGLKIGENTDRTADFLLNTPDSGDQFTQEIMIGVAHVDANTSAPASKRRRIMPFQKKPDQVLRVF